VDARDAEHDVDTLGLELGDEELAPLHRAVLLTETIPSRASPTVLPRPGAT
jgi:hypothetical protein